MSVKYFKWIFLEMSDIFLGVISLLFGWYIAYSHMVNQLDAYKIEELNQLLPPIM